METLVVDGIKVFFKPEDRETAEQIAAFCPPMLPLIKEMWHGIIPYDCRIHVMTSGIGFVFDTAPKAARVIYTLFFPLWGFSVYSSWKQAAGLSQTYAVSYSAVGIKPPRLLLKADKRVGEKIHLPEEDMDLKLKGILAHELTHAFTGYLQLPYWLVEGIAMLTAERVLNKETVRPDTLSRLWEPAMAPCFYKRRYDLESVVRQYILGYWMTRYIEEDRPGWLNSLFERPRPPAFWNTEILGSYGIKPETFRTEMVPLMVSRFAKLKEAKSVGDSKG